jgi:hypothetical protein
MLITALGVISIAICVWFTWHTYTSTQSAREAIIEAWINIVIGFSVNFLCNLVLLPLIVEGGHLTAGSNFWGGWVYTAISMLRQYGIRRWAAVHIQAFAILLARLIPTR